MCDYSLEGHASRPAEIGQRICTTAFPGTPTRGFCVPGDPGMAVCLRPGTELTFDAPIKTQWPWSMYFHFFRPSASRVAIFRKINENIAAAHHDALELENGRILLLTELREGQTARVLQLPPETGSSARPEPAQQLPEAAAA